MQPACSISSTIHVCLPKDIGTMCGTVQAVPVAHGFEGDRGALGELGEEGADGAGDVAHPSPLDQVPTPAEDDKEREVLVGITTDRII